MKKGNGKVMALCDTEEEYAQLMTEFMGKRKNMPWELHTYTNVDKLLQSEEKGLAMLVVAESAYRRELEELSPQCLIVLNESGVMKWEEVSYVDKYQEAE